MDSLTELNAIVNPVRDSFIYKLLSFWMANKVGKWLINTYEVADLLGISSDTRVT